MKRSILLMLTFLASAAASAQTPPMPAMPAAAAPAAATSPLPPVNMPASSATPVTSSLPALAPATPVKVETPIAAPSSESDASFSYGTAPYSLMYTPEQIDKMKKAVSVYELARRNHTDTPVAVVDEIAPTLAAVPTEPALYPVFTLKSIAYRAPSDWTVWIGNLRVTPRTNQQEVRVTGLNANSGSFVWKPAYTDALIQRNAQHMFANTGPIRHKLTNPNNARFDSQSGQVSFTLKPNQSFVPGYMATFEGNVAAPALAALAAVPAANQTASPATAPSTASPTGRPSELNTKTLQQLYDKANNKSSTGDTTTLDTLLKNQQNVQQFAPPGR